MAGIPEPNACSWCERPERGHDNQFWLHVYDRHPYYVPNDQQRLTRMLARRAERPRTITSQAKI